MSAARALFRVDFAVCQRSRGGDAVKLAAYNACGRLDHGGRTFDFRRKRAEHIGPTHIITPAGYPTDLFPNVGSLWRAAEAAEKRGDAQTARQLLITIPREVPPDRRYAFVRHCVGPLTDAGMVVQVDLHEPGARDGDEQPHAHVLATMRELAADGSGFSKTKTVGRDWNRLFTENRGRAMRRQIADRMNTWFQAHGLAARVDHRTNAEADGPDSIPPEPQVSRAAVEVAKRQPADLPAEIARLDIHRRQRRAVREIDASVATTQARIREIHAARQPAAAAPKTQAGRPRPMHNKLPWMQETSGVDGLSPAHLASARRSYDRWKEAQVKRGRAQTSIFGFDAYVDYVQDRRSKGEQNRGVPRLRDNKEAAFDASTGPVPEPGPNPDPVVTGWTRRKRFLASLLAEHYDLGELDPGIIAHIQRVKLDREARTATVFLRDGSHFIDHGDRIEFRGAISQPSACEIAAAAARHGWSKVALTGTPDFRDETAIALSLREPPIEHDHELSPAAAARLAAGLAEREAARPVTAGIAPAPATDVPTPTVNSIAPVPAPSHAPEPAAEPEPEPEEPAFFITKEYDEPDYEAERAAYELRREQEYEAELEAHRRDELAADYDDEAARAAHDLRREQEADNVPNAPPPPSRSVVLGRTGAGPDAAAGVPPGVGGGAAGGGGVSPSAGGRSRDGGGDTGGGVVEPPPPPRDDARAALARSDAVATALLSRRPNPLSEKALRAQGATAIRAEEERLKTAVAAAQTAAETAARNRSLLSAASRRTATEADARLTAARDALATFERAAVERYEGANRLAADAARFRAAEIRAFDARPEVVAALRQQAANAIVRDSLANPESDPELISALEYGGSIADAQQLALRRVEQRAQQQAAAEAEQQAVRRADWDREDAEFEQRRAHRFGG